MGWSVGWQPPGSWPPLWAIQPASSAHNPWGHQSFAGCVGWQPWAACDVVIPSGKETPDLWEIFMVRRRAEEIPEKSTPRVWTISGGCRGLLKGHSVFCFTHGAPPQFTSEYMKKWGLTNLPLKDITAKIIAFWWSRGYLLWNGRYPSVTLLMKGTARQSFETLRSAHLLPLSSILLAIYGISLISQQN